MHRLSWYIGALAILIAWFVYSFTWPIEETLKLLGGATMFRLLIPLLAMLMLLQSRWRWEALYLAISSAGFVAMNHLMTLLRGNPPTWSPLIMVTVFGPAVAMCLVPLVTFLSPFAKAPANEPAQAEAMKYFTMVQLIPLLTAVTVGCSVALLTPTATSTTSSSSTLFVVLLFVGLGAGSLTAKALVRRLTESQLRTLYCLAPDDGHRLRPHLVILGLWVFVAGGFGLESFRGEWATWGAQTFGMLTVFWFLWPIYRLRFRAHDRGEPPLTGTDLPKLPFWVVLTVMLAVAVILVTVIALARL